MIFTSYLGTDVIDSCVLFVSVANSCVARVLSTVNIYDRFKFIIEV